MRRSFAIILLGMLALALQVSADELAPPVRATYAAGDTTLDTLKPGAQCFANRDHVFESLPADVVGLSFARRDAAKPVAVEIEIAAGATVYLLVDTESNPKGGPELNKRLADSGWTRLENATRRVGPTDSKPNSLYKLAVYKRDFANRDTVSLDKATWSGYIVAARQLEIATATPNKLQVPRPKGKGLFADDSLNGPTTRGAPKTIRSGDDLAKRAGKVIEIEGVAANAKLGAAVILDDHVPVYIEDQSDWPPDTLKTRVRVEGTLSKHAGLHDPTAGGVQSDYYTLRSSASSVPAKEE